MYWLRLDVWTRVCPTIVTKKERLEGEEASAQRLGIIDKPKSYQRSASAAARSAVRCMLLLGGHLVITIVYSSVSTSAASFSRDEFRPAS
jgi:hypothetical protein